MTSPSSSVSNNNSYQPTSPTPSSSTVISIVDDKNSPSADKTIAPPVNPKLTPKQEALNAEMNVENEILIVLYRKRDLGQMTVNDKKEIKTRKENLDRLKKKLHELKLSRERSMRFRGERKRKFDSLDEITRKKMAGKETSDPGRPINRQCSINRSHMSHRHTRFRCT